MGVEQEKWNPSLTGNEMRGSKKHSFLHHCRLLSSIGQGLVKWSVLTDWCEG